MSVNDYEDFVHVGYIYQDCNMVSQSAPAGENGPTSTKSFAAETDPWSLWGVMSASKISIFMSYFQPQNYVELLFSCSWSTTDYQCRDSREPNFRFQFQNTSGGTVHTDAITPGVHVALRNYNVPLQWNLRLDEFDWADFSTFRLGFGGEVVLRKDF